MSAARKPITPEDLIARWGQPPAPWMPAHMAAFLNAHLPSCDHDPTEGGNRMNLHDTLVGILLEFDPGGWDEDPRIDEWGERLRGAGEADA